MLPSSSTLRLPGLCILISCMSYMISKCVFIEGSRPQSWPMERCWVPWLEVLEGRRWWPAWRLERERERERERAVSQSVSQSVPGKCGDTPVSLTICRVTGNIRSSSSKWSLLSLLLVERLEEISQCESLSLSGLAAVLRPGQDQREPLTFPTICCNTTHFSLFYKGLFRSVSPHLFYRDLEL